jgi:hypothetical protein
MCWTFGQRCVWTRVVSPGESASRAPARPRSRARLRDAPARPPPRPGRRPMATVPAQCWLRCSCFREHLTLDSAAARSWEAPGRSARRRPPPLFKPRDHSLGLFKPRDHSLGLLAGGAHARAPRPPLVASAAILVSRRAPLLRGCALVRRTLSLRLAGVLRLRHSFPVLLQRSGVSLEPLEPVADAHSPQLLRPSGIGAVKQMPRRPVAASTSGSLES